MLTKELVIIGAGPAGLAAALAAKAAGVQDILVIEREKRAGGILNQCIHDGFGLHIFGEALTGPEYAQRYIEEVERAGIEILTDTMVTDLTREKLVTIINRQLGLLRIQARAVILAMGSRERTASGISLPGKRLAGIYTAGLVQNLQNLHNIRVGKRAVIVGSGDIGLIMARRLTLEGAQVQGVIELLPYSNGLPRNLSQCLADFGIPLRLSHTVVDVEGSERVEAVVIAQVDEQLRQVPGSEERIECDTLILSVGLIPENELSRQAGVHLDELTGGPLVKENYETNIAGIFACGNVLHIHDLVDFVSGEAAKAGSSAARYILDGSKPHGSYIFLETGPEIRYVLPQLISNRHDQELSLRVSKPGRDQEIQLLDGARVLYRKQLKKVLPSEMIQCTIRQAMLRDVNSTTLKVVLK